MREFESFLANIEKHIVNEGVVAKRDLFLIQCRNGAVTLGEANDFGLPLRQQLKRKATTELSGSRKRCLKRSSPTWT